MEPFPDLLAPTPLRQPGLFLRGLRSTSPATLSSTQTCSAGNEGPDQYHATPSKVANTPAASNLPTESVVQLRRSPRFLQSGQLDSPSFHSGQSGLVPGDKAEPPDTYTSRTDISSSETTGYNVVTEPPHQIRELGSLSPVSEDVLHNLLSTTEAITTAPLDQIPALASVFPANQPPCDRPSSPERNHSVAIHSVQRPPPERSPWRSHIANPASPSKFCFNSTLHDPNRTPARRVPIKEAIAQGSVSPQKSCPSGPSTGIFGRPVFTRFTPGDRTCSPVRRPSSEIVNHTVVGSSGIARPTASTPSGKVRSGSEEPQISRRPHLGRPFQRSASDSDISSPPKTKVPAFPTRLGINARLPSTIPEEHGVDSPMKSTQSSPSLKSTLRQPSSMAGSRIPRIGAKPYARPPEKEKRKGEGKEPVHKLFMTKRPTSGSAPVSRRRNC